MLARLADTEIVWAPIPGSSQQFAMDSRCHHTLYCGTRGPGKSDTQLMRFRRNVGVGFGPFWRGIIFDREYKNLDDLVTKAQRWFNAFGDGAKWLSSAKDYKWVWPTGEELMFRTIMRKEEYWNYHGQEYAFIGWNELCKYPTSELYDMMMSCNRSSFTPEKDTPKFMKEQGQLLPRMPLEVFSTTNPYGAGHAWVKRRFIDPAPYGTVVRTTSRVFDPAKQCEVDVTKTQIAIFGTYRENIYLSVEYIAELDKTADENMREAWLYGNWDIVAGGAISDVFRKQKHVVPRFKIPPSWYVDRSFDWGSTTPFCTMWFAEANGETVELSVAWNGSKQFTPKPGSIIIINDYYGATEFGTNKGLKLSSSQIAEDIIATETQMKKEGWIASVAPGPADNQIRAVRESDVDTIEKKMLDHGIEWTLSDKSPGSRKIGLELIRDRLSAVLLEKDDPGLYFMESARAANATIPTLPRSEKVPDDVNDDAEDHAYDALRYRVLAGNNRFVTDINVNHGLGANNAGRQRTKRL